MTTIALSCANMEHATRRQRSDVQWIDMPEVPGRAEIDPVLAEPPDRVVVHGTDAALAAVVLRVLRKNLLQELAVGYVPVAESPAGDLWGLWPGAFKQAFDGHARPSPLIRDDSGGVLLGRGKIEPITGQAYCDDKRMLDGPALSLRVGPDPDADPLPEPTSDPIATQPPPVHEGLRVTVTRRRLLGKRRETARGRAVQGSFEDATVVADGVAHPREMHRWAWYRHTEDLLLIRP